MSTLRFRPLLGLPFSLTLAAAILLSGCGAPDDPDPNPATDVGTDGATSTPVEPVEPIAPVEPVEPDKPVDPAVVPEPLGSVERVDSTATPPDVVVEPDIVTPPAIVAPAEPDVVTPPAIVAPAEPEDVESAHSSAHDDAEEPFDPIKENGEFFKDWPEVKPKLVLVFSGRLDGYMEPCGCAGMDRMKGGLSRRYSLLKELREKRGWPVAVIDVGGLIKRSGAQGVMKLDATVNTMHLMEYDAIGLGGAEMRIDSGHLLSVTASTAANTGVFVSANVGVLGFGVGMTNRRLIIEVGGMKLGVTSVLGEKWRSELASTDNDTADAAEKLAELVPSLQAECDYMVLLAHATTEESEVLAKAFPQFDLVVTAGGVGLPPNDWKPGELVEVGEKGMGVAVVGLFDDPQQPVRYQQVILDSRYEAAPAIKKVMAFYQEQLEGRDLSELIGAPVPLDKEELGEYVGSKKCESCHEPSYDIWKKSKHSKAWKSLAVTSDPPRTFDPECISCHVVGWNPANHLRYESSFLNHEQTPELINVGCENCHGPGENHVDAEMPGADRELQEKLRKAVTVSKEQTKKMFACEQCHDGDNSPDFDFETYWPKIEHYEDLP